MDDRNVDLIKHGLHVDTPFGVRNLAGQTSEQGEFVDAVRHRRINRRHGCRQVFEPAIRHFLDTKLR